MPSTTWETEKTNKNGSVRALYVNLSNILLYYYNVLKSNKQNDLKIDGE